MRDKTAYLLMAFVNSSGIPVLHIALNGSLLISSITSWILNRKIAVVGCRLEDEVVAENGNAPLDKGRVGLLR